MAARYEFVRVIGQGGSGWVALATDTRLGRPVAIKTVYGGTADESAVARLRREARALAAVEHLHVARVFRLVAGGSDVFIVMEYAGGGDLGQALATGQLTGAEAVRVLVQTASALEHAHACGIVHRDVKPGNILLTDDRRAKLADFGLARLPRSANAFRTVDGSLSGTVNYLAPEQADPAYDGPSIDAYAFATVAYEVLTGRLPFPSLSAADTLRARQTEEPVSALVVAPSLPPRVAEALRDGLVRDPGARLSPAGLAQALAETPDPVWDSIFESRVPAGQAMSPSTDRADVTLGAEVGWSTRRAPATFAYIQQDDDEGTSIGTPELITAPVYRPPSRRRGVLRARAVGVVVGVVVGAVVAVLLLQS